MPLPRSPSLGLSLNPSLNSSPNLSLNPSLNLSLNPSPKLNPSPRLNPSPSPSPNQGLVPAMAATWGKLAAGAKLSKPARGMRAPVLGSSTVGSPASSGFTVHGSAFRVTGCGFRGRQPWARLRVQGSAFTVQRSGLRVADSGALNRGLACEFRVNGSRFSVQGYGLRIQGWSSTVGSPACSGFSVQGPGLRATQVTGCGFRVEGCSTEGSPVCVSKQASRGGREKCRKMHIGR